MTGVDAPAPILEARTVARRAPGRGVPKPRESGEPGTRRISQWLGHERPGEWSVPWVDRTHRLKHLRWAGDEAPVNGYIDDNGLARHALCSRLVQALIEPAELEECTIRESLTDHIVTRAGMASPRRAALRLEPMS